MVTIIAQEEPLNFNVVHGADLTKSWIGDLSVFDEDNSTILTTEDVQWNVGLGKSHPGDITCNHNGKEILMLVFNILSGLMTLPILVQILEYLDKLEVFPSSLYPGSYSMGKAVTLDLTSYRI